MLEQTAIQTFAIWVIPVLFAITLHEVAHGYVASKFGDQTAKFAGRLTINPIHHIDLVGTVLVPLLMFFGGGFIFGWAKPVPVDARNMRHPRRDMVFVAAAGPIANLLMALFWGGIMKLGYYSNPWFHNGLINMGDAGIRINLVLAILNCLPIPPLDGGRILYNILPPRIALKLYRIEPFGFLILILLMVTNLLGYIIAPPFYMLYSAILSLFGLG